VIEGLSAKGTCAFSVQYHPEAGPGPHDARYLFDSFEDLMWENASRSRVERSRPPRVGVRA
jgi:carbamoylphosphate synthase small subunit